MGLIGTCVRNGVERWRLVTRKRMPSLCAKRKNAFVEKDGYRMEMGEENA